MANWRLAKESPTKSANKIITLNNNFQIAVKLDIANHVGFFKSPNIILANISGYTVNCNVVPA